MRQLVLLRHQAWGAHGTAHARPNLQLVCHCAAAHTSTGTPIPSSRCCCRVEGESRSVADGNPHASALSITVFAAYSSTLSHADTQAHNAGAFALANASAHNVGSAGSE